MDWWVLEAAQVVALLVLAVFLQRVLRRSGAGYVEELFKETPQIGRAFVLLADIGLYLIFAAYTLFNVQLRSDAPRVNAGQGEEVVYSIAGIALIVGILHLVNVVFLPLLSGLLAGRTKGQGVEGEGSVLSGRLGSLLVRVSLEGGK